MVEDAVLVIHRVRLVMGVLPIIVSPAQEEWYLMRSSVSLNARVTSSTRIQSVQTAINNVLHALERVILSVCLVLKIFN